MDLQIIFKVLVVYIVIEKSLEFLLSWTNMNILRRQGKTIEKEKLVSILGVIQFIWAASLIYFAFLNHYDPDFTIAIVCLSFFLVGQLLKVFSIFSFGQDWSLHSSILLKSRDNSSGVYRILRHPHQIGSLLESFSLPFFAGLYTLGTVYGVVYLMIFIVRLKFEEKEIFNYAASEKALSLKKTN